MKLFFQIDPEIKKTILDKIERFIIINFKKKAKKAKAAKKDNLYTQSFNSEKNDFSIKVNNQTMGKDGLAKNELAGKITEKDKMKGTKGAKAKKKQLGAAFNIDKKASWFDLNNKGREEEELEEEKQDRETKAKHKSALKGKKVIESESEDTPSSDKKINDDLVDANDNDKKSKKKKKKDKKDKKKKKDQEKGGGLGIFGPTR